MNKSTSIKSRTHCYTDQEVSTTDIARIPRTVTGETQQKQIKKKAFQMKANRPRMCTNTHVLSYACIWLICACDAHWPAADDPGIRTWRQHFQNEIPQRSSSISRLSNVRAQTGETHRHTQTDVNKRITTPHQQVAGGLAVSASDCGVRGTRFESHHGRLCLSRQPLRYTALGTGCAPLLQCPGRLSLLFSVGW